MLTFFCKCWFEKEEEKISLKLSLQGALFNLNQSFVWHLENENNKAFWKGENAQFLRKSSLNQIKLFRNQLKMDHFNCK